MARKFTSGCRTIVVVQHATEPFLAANRPVAFESKFGNNQSIAEPLMISLSLIMRYELSNCSAQRVLAEEHQALQAEFPDGSHKSFRMCILIL